jgi:hypothetical protein
MPKQARVHVVSKSHILDAGRVYRTILSVCWNYISRNVVFVFMFIWNNVMGVHEVTTPVGTVLIQPRCTDVVGSRVVIFKCIKTVSTASYELSWQRRDVWVKQRNGKMILPPCCSSFCPFWNQSRSNNLLLHFFPVEIPICLNLNTPVALR